MIARVQQKDLEISLTHFPVVGLVGSRQSGKTTLAKMIATKRDAVYLDLERPSDLAKLEHPEIYLSTVADRLVVFDEIQRMPGLFPLLRSLVDEEPTRPGRFLVLGSASPGLIRQASESLAGRIIYHELTPFTGFEVGWDWHRLWVRGGYPRSFLADSDDVSFQWRESFIMTYLERDLPQLSVRTPASLLRRFWQITAHMQGQVWNASKAAASLGVSAPTIRRYVDIMQDTYMLRQLQPFHPNLKKRLVKSPKIYIRDSGLLHTLLNIPHEDILLGTPHAGPSFEGLVLEQIHSVVPQSWTTWFYRSSAGAEMDLVVLPPGKAPIGVEIKLTRSPRLSKGFRHAFSDLGCEQAYVVCPVDEAFPLDKTVLALPLNQIHRVVEG